MTRNLLIAVAIFFAVIVPSSGATTALASQPRLVQTAFHLQAPAAFSSGATFWVAYGPVGGKFGIVRLHHAASGQFVASARFPAGSRATFYYIQGQGVIHTRAGAAPGNPISTLGHQGPFVIGRQSIPLFRASPAG